MRWQEIFIGAASVVGGLLLLLVIIPQEVVTLASQTEEISPALFPNLLSVLLIILGCIHLINYLFRYSNNNREYLQIKSHHFLRALIGLLICSLYVLILPLFGYIFATFSVLIILIMHIGLIKFKRAIFIAIPTSFILYILFSKGLNVPLPRFIWLD